jgi:hypothetical protein
MKVAELKGQQSKKKLDLHGKIDIAIMIRIFMMGQTKNLLAIFASKRKEIKLLALTMVAMYSNT